MKGQNVSVKHFLILKDRIPRTQFGWEHSQ